jgi:anthranilate synthase component 1
MTEIEFNRLAAEGYNRIPVTLETFADLDTPLSIYLKLANEPYSYLLESVQGGERFGRYSFIGLAAGTRIAVVDGAIMVLSGNRVAERRDHTNPMSFISEFMARFKVPDLPGLPRFCGGLVGVFGYDTVRFVEPKLAETGTSPKPPAWKVCPTSCCCSPKRSPSSTTSPASSASSSMPSRASPVPGSRRRRGSRSCSAACARRWRSPRTYCVPRHRRYPNLAKRNSRPLWPAKQYIVDGDIMQVVLSQRMKKPFAASPMALYRALRTLNPSPYMFYFNFQDFHVVGASPEILVRLEDAGEEDGHRAPDRRHAQARRHAR